MRLGSTICMMTVVGLLCAPGWALAQNAITAPAQKTIGQSKVEIVPSLIVMNARGASLQSQTLTLTGVSPSWYRFLRPACESGGAHAYFDRAGRMGARRQLWQGPTECDRVGLE